MKQNETTYSSGNLAVEWPQIIDFKLLENNAIFHSS